MLLKGGVATPSTPPLDPPLGGISTLITIALMTILNTKKYIYM